MPNGNKRQKIYYVTEAEDELFWQLYCIVRKKHRMTYSAMVVHALKELCRIELIEESKEQ